MKFLLLPENNSLSHIAKALSIKELLEEKGHEVHMAVSKKHVDFVKKFGTNYHILPDIQEADQGGFPTFKWFSNIDTMTKCIQEEVALIENIQPDRVLGIFRFTLYTSAQITQVPYDSLISGCMIPDCHDVLGFRENEDGIETQEYFLNNFFRYAGAKTSRVLKLFGIQEIDDIRVTLKGNRTFLWDFPEFMPIKKSSNTIHVGPINLHHWPYDMANIEKALDTQYPIAVVSFGTCVTDRGVVLRIVRLLVELGFHVIVAAGGQSPMSNIELVHPQVTVVNFAPLNELFPYASLLVTHGGQMTIFEALQNKVPVCVMPFQPEQAHNGVCLERIGCGCRLIPPTFFTGLVDDYISSFIRVTDQEIKIKIDSLLGSAKTKESLSKTKSIIERYHGADSIVEFLEVI